MGIGTATETFSNIKTPLAGRKIRGASQTQIGKTLTRSSQGVVTSARGVFRPRYLAHLGLIGLASILVFGNNPSRAHSLSVRLMSAQAGSPVALDQTATAKVAADIAASSQMLVTQEASKTATVKKEQVALLTADGAALAKRQVVSTAGNATRDISSYVVQPGDTLSGVASKFNITSATLKWANDLSDADSIKPGQSLTILPVSGLLYTVQSGDTADSLAAKFSANAAQILSFNNGEVKGLSVGEKIIIPDGVKADAPKPAVASTATRSTFTPTHLTAYFGGGNGYSFGYCTWYVASRRSVPSNWGNANAWYYNAQASGFSVGSVPVPGAIAWTGAGYYGHVAYVEGVSGGMVTVSEMNYNGNWDRVTSRTVPASSFRYIY
jgi:surface antigen